MDATFLIDAGLLAARLLLAVVFLVAGFAKLADRAGSRKALLDFGVPAALAAQLGVLLPLTELAIAVSLVPTATAWQGALAALTLLLLFVAGIGINLARGRKPECHCFGQLHSAPVGWATLARNGLLAAVAGLVVWQGQENPGPSLLDWLGWLRDPAALQGAALAGEALILLLLAAVVWLLVQLMAQNGRLVLRLEALETRLGAGGATPTAIGAPAQPEAGLPLGAPAPGFSLAGLYGELLTLDFLRASGKPVLLVFSDPNCGPCNGLLPELGLWQRDHATGLTIALVSRGTPEANRAKCAEHGLTHVLLQRDREVAEAYQAVGTPSAVIVRPDGTIGSPLAAGVDAIRALMARTVGAPAAAPSLPLAPSPATAPGRNGTAMAPPVPLAARLGTPAPPIRLPDLNGNTVDLADFRAGNTLVLFWNPGCGFCQQMLEDLKAWEANPPPGAPRLLVVSSGTVEANRAMGLRAPVVLDQTLGVMSAFGTNGTPTAVLVDAQGKIASDLAVGAPAVLALARAHPGQARPASA